MKLHTAIAALLMSMSAVAFADKPVAPLDIVSEEIQNKIDDVKVQLGLCLKNSQTPLGIKLCNEDADEKLSKIKGAVESHTARSEPTQPAIGAEVVPAPAVESTVPGPYISFSAGSRPQPRFTTTVR